MSTASDPKEVGASTAASTDTGGLTTPATAQSAGSEGSSKED